ncbi:MAG: IS66 family insertion sequence element accessory protein TnpB [bacterium]
MSLRECLPSGRSRSAAKRLQRSRFVWLQAISGPVSLSSAQLSMLLEAIDWRRPQRTRQPGLAA